LFPSLLPHVDGPAEEEIHEAKTEQVIEQGCNNVKAARRAKLDTNASRDERKDNHEEYIEDDECETCSFWLYQECARIEIAHSFFLSLLLL
jgi:hypothetical protein